MVTITTINSWEHSFGVAIPKKAIKEAGFHNDEKVVVTIQHTSHPLREVYSILKRVKPKTRKSTDTSLKEIDEEFKSKWD